MKNMKKIIAVLLSMTAIASTTAFAEEAEEKVIEAEYASGKASLILEDDSIEPAANGQITVVIVPKNAKTIDSNNIYYINQGDFATEMLGEKGILANMLVKETYDKDAAEKYPEGYEVRIGGLADGTYRTFYFKVEEEEVIIYGDVNGDKIVDNKDKISITRHLLGWESFAADKINYAAADVNTDKVVDNKDKIVIVRHLLGWEAYKKLPF